jgi:8-oxo-dGTP diphosphatase
MLLPSAKLWLKLGDTPVIGAGRAKLLRAIAEHGSISKAAESMNMSYRHAWGKIKQIRESVGDEVVITNRGGRKGGGAKLTKTGQQLLEQYETSANEIDRILKYGPKPSLAVDGLIMIDDELVLIRRGNPPFKGMLALPGGFVEYNETTEFAVLREVEEELGIKAEIIQLLGVYSDPMRDPRQHTVSVVYELRPLSRKFIAGDDASDFEKIPIKKLPNIIETEVAFDHGQIIQDFLKIKNAKKRYQ